jgi:hypothetical protein
MQCPKCHSEVREINRFCRRCHATLRYECPACRHEQRHGGSCDKCGVDFLKYLTAMISAKRSEVDADRDKLERRSLLMKNVIYFPLTLGIPLLRNWLVGKRDSQNVRR